MDAASANAEIERLNIDSARPGAVSFAWHPLGGVAAHLVTPHGSAIVALHGAHVLSYKPKTGDEVLWMSPQARIAPGQGIRGGIPVCWPWFATHATDRAKPDHGFVRKVPWRVVRTFSDRDSAGIELSFATTDEHVALWEGSANLRAVVTLTEVLRVDLITGNTGVSAFHLTEALHTYFAIGDIARVAVQGLSGRTYQDKLTDYARTIQDGDITFSGEVDRIYENTPDDVVIVDPDNARKIRVAKEGSTSTVVWNPWVEKSKQVSDMPPGAHRSMVCVETTNAGGDVVRLEPSQQHRLSAILSVEPI